MPMSTSNGASKPIYITIIIKINIYMPTTINSNILRNHDVGQRPTTAVGSRSHRWSRLPDNRPFYKSSSVSIIKPRHSVCRLTEKHHPHHPFSLLCLVRDDTSLHEQRKSSSKIIANLTTHSADEQPRQPSPPLSASQKLQTQLSVQDTIQRHFCQILKNDSLTVTDKTSITETILMRENGSSNSSAISECF